MASPSFNPRRQPQPRTSDEVRLAFRAFFESKDHLILPSSSLVPLNDPTVLLTTAGVQQLVPFMLGEASPPHPRLASVQKCFRTTDIDQVGNQRTLTFFEMLGNFSVGDYFKQEAIAWAWEFVTEWLQLSSKKVYVTVHPSDEEARQIWFKLGISTDRLTQCEDNWWGPPGDEGPCGPDTELYFDRGEPLGCGRPGCGPGCDCERFLEFWNLVFAEFYQDREGRRTTLPRKNIDTGMGLERVAALVADVPSVYESDLLEPILQGVGARFGREYGRDAPTDRSLRVLADHGRAMTFLAAEGVLPGNEGREYVLRRIVRRAVRHGRVLGAEGPFISEILSLVVERMAPYYPELLRERAAIREVLEREEQLFSRTLESGLGRLETWIAEATAKGSREIDGERLFNLYDTYGFPLELSEEVLSEAGLRVDRERIERARERARQVSRGERSARIRVASPQMGQDLPSTLFLGYQTSSADTNVLALVVDGAAAQELPAGGAGSVILQQSPFYADAGGQVGDTGLLVGPDVEFAVEDTRSDGLGHILHEGRTVRGVLRVGQPLTATVDEARRWDIRRHHTITHILHRALRDVLGEGAKQRGSLVSPEVARFDFSHPSGLTQEQLDLVTQVMNEQLLANFPVRATVMPLHEAQRIGADMFFGEKYGERVRVVEVGGYSKELCGGTHVDNSGQIGSALIVHQESAGSGLRRLYVVAGLRALNLASERLGYSNQVAALLGVSPSEVVGRLGAVLEELKTSRKAASRGTAGPQVGRLVEAAERVDGVAVVAQVVHVDDERALRNLVDLVKERLPSSIVALGAVINGKPRVAVGVSSDLAEQRLHAGKLAQSLAGQLGGSGGGHPHMGTGGGTEHEKLPTALQAMPQLVRESLRG